ncbi:winged helix-turn-helix transcriptional regulator [Mycolicibacterium grossiae]|uniref:winged helix-turn-helix transcriptional regulator n=1 Tax=Mycolicibacterium grossiae TaxID=1552759 RepID=UPI002E1A08B3
MLDLGRAVLTDRLRRLVDLGVLERRPYRDAQRTRHEYRLTQKGHDLYPVLMALRPVSRGCPTPPARRRCSPAPPPSR